MMSLPRTYAELSGLAKGWHDSGRHLDVDGDRVFVYEAGSGPNVVFIHGFPTSGFDWRETINELTDSFRCVAIDLRGFGLSDKPPAWSYSLFQQADLVESVVAQMGMTTVHVVSHDMGTSLHTELLARQEEGKLGFELTHSTFTNGSMIKSMAELSNFQKLLEAPANVPRAAEVCAAMMPTYVDGLKRLMARPESVTDEIKTIMHDVMSYQYGNERIPAVYCYVRERYLHTERWLDALRANSGPTQFVWGAADPVAVIEMGRELSKRVPHARFTELEGVGHFVPTEAPQEVATAIRALAAALLLD